MVTEVTVAERELELGCVVWMVALVAESNAMLGLIIIIIPQPFVTTVPVVELKVVTDEKRALKLNTKDCAVAAFLISEVPGVFVFDPVTDDTKGLLLVT